MTVSLKSKLRFNCRVINFYKTDNFQFFLNTSDFKSSSSFNVPGESKGYVFVIFLMYEK